MNYKCITYTTNITNYLINKSMNQYNRFGDVGIKIEVIVISRIPHWHPVPPR